MAVGDRIQVVVFLWKYSSSRSDNTALGDIRSDTQSDMWCDVQSDIWSDVQSDIWSDMQSDIQR